MTARSQNYCHNQVDNCHSHLCCCFMFHIHFHSPKHPWSVQFLLVVGSSSLDLLECHSGCALLIAVHAHPTDLCFQQLQFIHSILMYITQQKMFQMNCELSSIRSIDDSICCISFPKIDPELTQHPPKIDPELTQHLWDVPSHSLCCSFYGNQRRW